MKTDSKAAANLNSTKAMVLTALIFATAIVLSIIENSLPPVMASAPGVKFGLSNIAVMYALFFLGKKQAYTIAVLKGFFGFATRGAVAGLLSLAGGILSLTIMIILLFIFKDKISYMIASIAGAVFHNIGQFIVIALIYTGMNMLAYFPVLLISGVIAGIVTSTLLKFILPAFNRLV